MNTQSAADAVAVADAPPRLVPRDRSGYLVAGAGVPVVMLHSSLGSKSQWTALAERLAMRRFRVDRGRSLRLWRQSDPVRTGSVVHAGRRGSCSSRARIDRLVASHGPRPRRRPFVWRPGCVAVRAVEARARREPLAVRAGGVSPALSERRRGAGRTCEHLLEDHVAALVAAGLRHDAAQASSWISGAAPAAYARASIAGSRASIARRDGQGPARFPRRRASWPLRRGRTSARSSRRRCCSPGSRSPAVAQRIVALAGRGRCRIAASWWFDVRSHGADRPCGSNQLPDRDICGSVCKGCRSRRGPAAGFCTRSVRVNCVARARGCALFLRQAPPRPT